MNVSRNIIFTQAHLIRVNGRNSGRQTISARPIIVITTCHEANADQNEAVQYLLCHKQCSPKELQSGEAQNYNIALTKSRILPILPHQPVAEKQPKTGPMAAF